MSSLSGAVVILVLAAPGQAAEAPDHAVPALIRDLSGPEAGARLRAVRDLGNLGLAARDAISELSRALRDPSPELRNRAHKALAQIGKPAVPALVASLFDADAGVRTRAARALALIGPEAREAVPALMDTLRDRHDRVRASAVLALGEIGADAKAAAPALVRALRDPSAVVRQEAITALVRIGPEAIAPLAEGLRDASVALRLDALRVVELFGARAKALVPTLRETLKDPDYRIRAASASALASMGTEAEPAVPELLEALKDRKYEVQVPAVNALLILASRGTPGLLEKIRAADRGRGWVEPLILREFGPNAADAVMPLIKQVNGKDRQARLQAMLTLAELGSQARPAVTALTRALKDDDQQVRLQAAVALARIKRKNAEMNDAVQNALIAMNKGLGQLVPAGPLDGAKLLQAWKDPPTQERVRRFLTNYVMIATAQRHLPAAARQALEAQLAHLGVEAVPALVATINDVAARRVGFLEPMAGLNGHLARLMRTSSSPHVALHVTGHLGAGVPVRPGDPFGATLQHTRSQAVAMMLHPLWAAPAPAHPFAPVMPMHPLAPVQPMVMHPMMGHQAPPLFQPHFHHPFVPLHHPLPPLLPPPPLPFDRHGAVPMFARQHGEMPGIPWQGPMGNIHHPGHGGGGPHHPLLNIPHPAHPAAPPPDDALGRMMLNEIAEAQRNIARMRLEMLRRQEMLRQELVRREEQVIQRDKEERQDIAQLLHREMLETLIEKATHETPEALRGRLRDPNPLVRWIAVQLVGSRRLPLEDELIERLEEGGLIAETARQSLVRLGRGTDFGPLPGAGKATRARAIERWKSWLALQRLAASGKLIAVAGTDPRPRSDPGQAMRIVLDRQKSAAEAEDAQVAHLADELVRSGKERWQEALDHLKISKGGVYTDALAVAIPRLQGDQRNRAREALAERLTRMKAATLKDKLQDEDAEVRRAAARACALKEAKEQVPDLIPLLLDPERSVATAAHSALKELTGRDFGPKTDAGAGERTLALLNWRQWWKTQKAPGN